MAARTRRPRELLGKRLRTLRHEQGWSLEELAARSGASRSTLSLIECGRPDGRPMDPRLSTVLAMARAFGMSLSEFVCDGPPPRSLPKRRERIGQRVRRFRKERDLSVIELAEKARMGFVVLHEWENGASYHHRGKVDPQLSTLLRMAKALKMSLGELVGA